MLILKSTLKKQQLSKLAQNGQVCEVCWSNVLQGVDAHIERFPV